MQQGHLLAAIPSSLPIELTETLVERRGVRVERILSRGQASPDDFWYDQDQHEFVFVAAGRARLEFEDARVVELGPGDWLQIDAHVRHRVAFTAPDQVTVWLALFFDP